MATSPERDRSIETLLRQSLAESATVSEPTDACLDAETIAAWVDGGLSGSALEMVETHLAGCHRCQELSAAMGRAAAAAPSLASEPLHDRPARRWLGWAVPFAAAAAGVIVWVAVSRDPGSGIREVESGSGVAQRADEPASQPSAPAAGQIAVQRADEPAPQPTAPVPSQAPPLRDERAQPPQGARPDPTRQEYATAQPPASLQESIQLKAESPSPEAADAAAAPSGATQGAAQPSAPSAPAEQNAAQETRRAVAAPAAAPPAAPRAAAPAPAFNNPRVATLARTAAQEIPSPDPRVRWRILGAALEQTTDGGSTWQGVPTNSAAMLTAGSAPSATTCWVVGRSGTVLLSADGRTWRRVAFPESVDLSAVQSTDARTATVTTADGRAFVTADGGATWARR